MRFTVIVAARTGSRRLPGKVLLPFGGKPLIAYLLERLQPSRLADRVVLATTRKAEDDALAQVAEAMGVAVFRGEEDDLVSRYQGACAMFQVDHAVRVTGDCPFVDADSLDHCLLQCRELPGFDLATTKGRFPVGIDYEIFPAGLLQDFASRPDLNAEHREHLTLYAYARPSRYRIARLAPPPGLVPQRAAFTVDTPEDYARMSRLAQLMDAGPLPLARLLAAAEDDAKSQPREGGRP